MTGPQVLDDDGRRAVLRAFADGCRRLHAAAGPPALLGCAAEAERLAADGWDEERLARLVAGVPPLRVPGQAVLVREVLALAMQLRVV